jgi:hypothetical protein
LYEAAPDEAALDVVLDEGDVDVVPDEGDVDVVPVGAAPDVVLDEVVLVEGVLEEGDVDVVTEEVVDVPDVVAPASVGVTVWPFDVPMFHPAIRTPAEARTTAALLLVLTR